MQGLNPLQLDSKAPSLPIEQFYYNESRFSVLRQQRPETAARLLELAQGDVNAHWATYERLAGETEEG